MCFFYTRRGRASHRYTIPYHTQTIPYHTKPYHTIRTRCQRTHCAFGSTQGKQGLCGTRCRARASVQSHSRMEWLEEHLVCIGQKTFFTKHPSYSFPTMKQWTQMTSRPPDQMHFLTTGKTWKRATHPAPRHPRHEKKRTHLLVLFHTIKGPMSTPRNPLTTHHTVPRTRAHTHTHLCDPVSHNKVISTVLSCNLCNPPAHV